MFLIAFALTFAYFRNNRHQQLIAYTITAMSLLLLVDLGVIHGLPTLVLQWMPIGILLVPFILKYCDHTVGPRWGGRYFLYILSRSYDDHCNDCMGNETLLICK